MDDNSIFRLTSGKIYITDNGDDAFIVRSGVLLVYVVSYQDDNYGRRDFLYEAQRGEVIPGFCYTDINLQNRRFLFTSRAGVELGIVPRGATKKLKADFLGKLGYGNTPAEDFRQTIVDRARAAEAADKAFIAHTTTLRAQTVMDISQLMNPKAHRSERDKMPPRREKGSIRETVQLIRQSVAGTKPLRAAGIIALSVAAAILMAALPLYFYFHFRYTDAMSGQAFPTMGFLILLLTIACSAAIQAIGGMLCATAATELAHGAEQTVFRRFFSLQYRFFREHETAEIAHLMVNARRAVTKIITNAYSCIGGVISAALCAGVCFWLSPGLMMPAVLLLTGWMAIYTAALHAVRKYRRSARLNRDHSDSLMYQFITGITKVRLAGAEEKAALEYLRPFVDYEQSEENRRLTVRFFDDAFAVTAVLLSALLAIFTDQVFVYEAVERQVAFVCAFTILSRSTVQYLRAFLSVGEEAGYVRRMTAILSDYEEGFEKATDDKPLTDGAITIDHLTFSYEKGADKVLDDLSLQIRAGEYIGVVGESGSGKSTLLKLLLGFETPDIGKISYDGMRLSQMDLHALRRQIGTVLQDGKLISGTIEENITVTKPDATPAQLQAAIRAADLEDDLYRMPMGTRTVLSEDGEMISGGQRQKILIARALLPAPKILLFDEATGALDNIAQKAVCDALDQLAVTRVVIAHRLSTVINCDRIIVLQDGRIAEEGSYEALMQQEGLFYAMAKRQVI